jgi:hypothetical protein
MPVLDSLSSYSQKLFSQQHLDKYLPTEYHLVQALGRRHGSLNRQAAHVLPALLQQGHEIVDSQHNIGDQLILSHANVSNGNTHTQHLLQLELDSRLDFGDLCREIFVVGDWGGEFTSCMEMLDIMYKCTGRMQLTLRKTRTQKTRDLLDKGIRCDERIILASKLLDQFLVLVELLQVIRRHRVNAAMFGTIDIVLITENAVRILLAMPLPAPD